MTVNYEKEQKKPLELVADGKKKRMEAEQTKEDLRLPMKALRDYTDIRQLTPEIVSALIRRMEVHSKDKTAKRVKADIYFTASGDSLCLQKKRCKRKRRRFAKTHSRSNFLHKAEHGAVPFQRLHRILHKNFVIRPRRKRVAPFSFPEHLYSYFARLPPMNFGLVRAASNDA